MGDGRYIFRKCVPAGSIDIGNVQQGGELLTREFTFRVNEPPELQSLVDCGSLDPRTILRGEDGELYDGDGNFLANVPTWRCQVDVQTKDYQPAAQKIVWAIPTGYTVTLTFTETIIRDAALLAKVMASLMKGAADVDLNFQGVIRGRAA